MTRPGGVPLCALLPMRRRGGFVPDSAAALAWAEELFQEGLAHPKPRCRRALVRDAVLIALLVMRAPRLRAAASLRLGVHLRRRGETWVLVQRAEINMTLREIEMPVPAEVGTMLDRYLAVERRELLRTQVHDWLWVSVRGDRLAEGAIARKLRVWSRVRFGVPVGPHRFRAAVTTLDGMVLEHLADRLFTPARLTQLLETYVARSTEADHARQAHLAEVLRRRLTGSDPAFRKACLRLFVSEIVVGDGEVRLRGPTAALARAASSDEPPPATEMEIVPGFVREWRPVGEKTSLRPQDGDLALAFATRFTPARAVCHTRVAQ